MSRLKLVFTVLLLCLSIPAAADVRVWFASGAKKVFRDEKPASAQKWELASARNEVEACQLVLLSDKAVQNVKVIVSGLRSRGGDDTLKASMNKVEYVPVGKEQVPWPDPLPPLTSIDLQPNKAQPIWISVRVPKDASPGLYKGTVKVEAGSLVRELPLDLRVWDFTLPDTPSCVTAFGMNWEFIALHHGVKMESAKLKELHLKYYEMLLDHKASSYYIPVDLMSEQADKYLNDPRMTSYLIPYLQNDEDLKKIVKRLIDGGWFKKAYFYPMDEPKTLEQYDQLGKIVQRLRSIEPNTRVVVPFDQNPPHNPGLKTFDLMLGKVNIWCPGSWLWDDANVWFPDRGPDKTLGPSVAKRQNAGENVWWYVCCNPGRPYANFWVDQNAMDHRILFWQQKMKGVEGILYWSTTWWNPDTGCPDPWKCMTTFTTINPNMYGDGSLMYPGKQVGVDGPVSSVRLEVIRDGIEDFEYLTLADQRMGKQASSNYIAKLVESLTKYEKDPEKLESVRRKLGSELEKATARMRKRL